MEYQAELDAAMAVIEDVVILSARAIEMSQTVMIIFKMDANDVWLAQHNALVIVRAVQVIGTNGYRLRLAGKMENGLTGMTMTISADNLRPIDDTDDLVEWADEYHVAKGLV